MEVYFDVNQAKVVVEERIRDRGKELVTLERLNLSWLRPLVKSLTGQSR